MEFDIPLVFIDRLASIILIKTFTGINLFNFDRNYISNESTVNNN